MEKPFFFSGASGYRLFGVLHQSESSRPLGQGEKIGGKAGLVLCNPLEEEKVTAHRIIVNLARAFAGEGLSCLRFDYMGSGDSDGEFEDTTMDTMLSDVGAAIQTMRTVAEVDEVGILGVRFGATLAALAAESSASIDPLVLIEPIVDGSAYMGACLRSNLTLQMAAYKEVTRDRKALVDNLLKGEEVSINGYHLTKTLYEQINALHLADRVGGRKNSVLLIRLGGNKSRRKQERQHAEMIMKYEAQGSQASVHVVEEAPFWVDSKVYVARSVGVEGAVLDWLRKR